MIIHIQNFHLGLLADWRRKPFFKLEDGESVPLRMVTTQIQIQPITERDAIDMLSESLDVDPDHPWNGSLDDDVIFLTRHQGQWYLIALGDDADKPIIDFED